MATNSREILSRIPGVDTIKQTPEVAELLRDFSEKFVTDIIREVIEEIRTAHKNEEPDAPSVEPDSIGSEVVIRARTRLKPVLRRVINGTGIVVHTNLGRSLLGSKTLTAVTQAVSRYCNLEIDIAEGRRGRRDSLIEPLLCAITGAEAATVVNNNAAAVMLSLDTLARGGEVLVSRGELVEIGGSFRIPDVMEKSAAKLVEVGTTNRTHLSDYERAISPNTSLLLKVHKSNYEIIGFTHEVSLAELAEFGQRRGIPVMEDLGSGALVDVGRFGLVEEPRPQNSIAAGADIVTFSGDKLLGGPQAGIIVGKSEYIKAIRKNPLMRALRVGKFTLSALGAILQTILTSREPENEIPTLKMLSRSPDKILQMIEAVRDELGADIWKALQADIVEGYSQAGGGSCPEQMLATMLLVLRPGNIRPDALARNLRMGDPSILGIIRDNTYCLDFRTVQEDEISLIAAALRATVAQ